MPSRLPRLRATLVAGIQAKPVCGWTAQGAGSAQPRCSPRTLALAGLARPVQQLVVDAFRTKAISFLAATTTLATSVNLPADRVIFGDAWVAKKDLALEPDRWAGSPGGTCCLGRRVATAGGGRRALFSRGMWRLCIRTRR